MKNTFLYDESYINTFRIRGSVFLPHHPIIQVRTRNKLSWNCNFILLKQWTVHWNNYKKYITPLVPLAALMIQRDDKKLV